MIKYFNNSRVSGKVDQGEEMFGHRKILCFENVYKSTFTKLNLFH